MSVTIAGIDFAKHDYDVRGDVLYLTTDSYDTTKLPPSSFSTPEGHNVEYDEDGHVIGMVLVNVKRLLERDGELKLTWPGGDVSPDELAPVLVATA